MHYMNEWLSEKNFFNLLKPYTDRKVILKEVICYIDKNKVKTVTGEIKGRYVTEPKGKGILGFTLISFPENGKTIAQSLDRDKILFLIMVYVKILVNGIKAIRISILNLSLKIIIKWIFFKKLKYSHFIFC